jgi:dihydroxy-acid dehydratase
MQPAGEFLGKEYFRAGGLSAIMAELLDAGKLRPDALTCNGKTVEQNVRGKHTWNRQIIRAYTEPMMKDAGFLHLKGSLFNSAIMKTCVISTAFRQRFLESPDDPNVFEGVVVVFDGPEDYHNRLDDPATPIDDRSILVMRGAGPMGYPGAAEVVNMHPPARLLREGITSLPCIGDGRQSGTSGSPSILNASPEAAAGGNLALLRDGDQLRVDLDKRRVDILIGEEELQRRREDLKVQGGISVSESQTPWQEILRRETDQLNEGMVLRDAVKYQRIAQRWAPRHNH